MSRLRYIIQRTVLSVFLILSLTVVLFVFFRTLPGDYATMMAQTGATTEQIEMVREQWGLNDPLHVQYLRWLENAMVGDFGRSRGYGVSVTELTIPYLMNSIILAAPAILTAYILGSAWGAVLGNAFGKRLEKIGIIPPVLFGTIPSFFLGIILLFLFAGGIFNIFPTQGAVSTEVLREIDSHWEIYLTRNFWWHFSLPFVTIVLVQLYYPTTIMRTSIIEIAGKDFDAYHRITGLSPFTRYKQRFKHGSLPVLTILPIALARAISGLVLVEVVFNWPGIGLLLVRSVLSRDVPVLQFIFLLVAIWIVAGNFIVDILYGVIDPRISVGDQSGSE